jgi:Uma2 family endonuclease
MSTTTKQMTAEELSRLPADGFRYELVEGELRQISPAGYDHGALAARLAGALIQHIEGGDLGEVCGSDTGFKIKTAPDTVRAPDVAFIRQERIAQVGDREGYGDGAPDLVVEVISPNDKVSEVEEKVQEWLEAGSALVWVISPRMRTVTVYRSQHEILVLTENDMLDGGDTVPGFQYPVARLFKARSRRGLL